MSKCVLLLVILMPLCFSAERDAFKGRPIHGAVAWKKLVPRLFSMDVSWVARTKWIGTSEVRYLRHRTKGNKFRIDIVEFRGQGTPDEVLQSTPETTSYIFDGSRLGVYYPDYSHLEIAHLWELEYGVFSALTPDDLFDSFWRGPFLADQGVGSREVNLTTLDTYAQIGARVSEAALAPNNNDGSHEILEDGGWVSLSENNTTMYSGSGLVLSGFTPTEGSMSMRRGATLVKTPCERTEYIKKLYLYFSNNGDWTYCDYEITDLLLDVEIAEVIFAVDPNLAKNAYYLTSDKRIYRPRHAVSRLPCVVRE